MPESIPQRHPLILSVFPGLDLLGLAFQQEWPECCIVRGPDVIWGNLHDVRGFHPPADVFDGIIGGPPCQAFSRMRLLQASAGTRHGNGIPEFCRVVDEAQPRWWLMENVSEVPPEEEPVVDCYRVEVLTLNNRWFGGEQRRVRRFWFGTHQRFTGQRSLRPLLDVVALEALRSFPPVLAGHAGGRQPRMLGIRRYSLAEMLELQGLPSDFLAEAPFTLNGKHQVVGNGVPLPIGRSIAKAVRRAVEMEEER